MKTIKKLFISVLVVVPYVSIAQSNVYLRADTVNISQTTEPAELRVKNKTKDSTRGILVNIGNGITRFERNRKLNDTTLKIGLDTFTVGSGSGTGGFISYIKKPTYDTTARLRLLDNFIDTKAILQDFGSWGTQDRNAGGALTTDSTISHVIQSVVAGIYSVDELRMITNITTADTGFTFIIQPTYNFRKTARKYKYNPNNTTGVDDGVTVIVAGTKRFEIIVEDAVWADWWEIDRTGVTDCSAEMQKAFDFTVDWNAVQKRTATLKVPSGVFLVKNLMMWKPSFSGSTITGYQFVTITVEGATPTYDVTTGLSPTTTFKTTAVDAFTLGVQYGRNCIIRNIAFWGPLTAPGTLAEIITWTDAQWLTGGIRNNAKSPQAAIVTEPYHGNVTAPDQYPGNPERYVGLASSGTSGLKMEYCAIYSYNVGVMVSPTGFSQNGDNIVMAHSYGGLCRIFWASGQPQSRSNMIIDHYSLGQIKYLLEGRQYGEGNGALPYLENCNIAGVHKYLYDFFGNLSDFTATDCHMELVWSLGRSGLRPVNFNNCYIEAVDFGTIAFQPAVFAQGDQINFTGGALSRNDNLGTMGFMFSMQQGVFFNGTWLYGGPVMVSGTNQGTPVRYNMVRHYDTGIFLDEGMTVGPTNGLTVGLVNGRAVIPGMKFYFGETGYVTTEITGTKEDHTTFEVATVTVNGTLKEISFTSANPWMYQVGDMLVSDNAHDDATDIYTAGRTVIGEVISIVGSVVTAKRASAAIANGASVWIRIIRFPNYKTPTIGDVGAGSATINNVKTTGGGFSVGDRIKGAGIPDGATVTAVGAGTLTISTNATANATATKLYDADYHIYGTLAATSALPANLVLRKGDIFYNSFATTSAPYAWVVTVGGQIGTGTPPTFSEVPTADNLVTLTGSQTLTNKTLGSPTTLAGILQWDANTQISNNSGAIELRTQNGSPKFTVSTTGGAFNGNVAYVSWQTITSGSSGTIGNTINTVLFDPVSSPIGTYTLTMPASPVDGQEITIVFGGDITAGEVVSGLTIAANTGQGLIEFTSPSVGNAGQFFAYRYKSSNAKWYRVK